MLSTIVTWIIFFFTLYTFGFIGLELYHKILKIKAPKTVSSHYNFFDIILIGCSLILIPLQIWSLFFPSNHIFLGLILALNICFLIYKRKQARDRLITFQKRISSFSTLQLVIIAGFVILTLIASVWLKVSFDSEFYHLHAIWWNETYPAIPGLGNIEDRLGFNSNFFLLSAIFSFRFLWGEPLYAFQSFIFIIFIISIFSQLFSSKKRLKVVIIFLGVTLFTLLNIFCLFSTSTDLIPNILFIYLLLEIFLNKDSLKNKSLLFLTVPLLIVTIKISLSPIILLPIVTIYLLIKDGIYWKKVISINIFFSLIIILWLIRNVILSGYLIYPIHELDLFSFDWKIPKEIAAIQKQYIYEYPVSVWKERLSPLIEGASIGWYDLLILGISFIAIILIPFLASGIQKKIKQKDNNLFFLSLIICLLSIATSMSSGFDFRFISGVVIYILIIEGVSLFNTVKINNLPRWTNYIVVSLFFISYGLWTSLYFISNT